MYSIFRIIFMKNFQESLSSTEVAHSNRVSCSFCIDRQAPLREVEVKRLNELLSDVEKLRTERMDLLRQNVTCKTDIKKLKERYVNFLYIFFFLIIYNNNTRIIFLIIIKSKYFIFYYNENFNLKF